ncbi:MAG: ABC transporter substrate-binding protein [Promethearchaeota archaeon]
MKNKVRVISACLILGITFSLVNHQSLAQINDHDTLTIGVEGITNVDLHWAYLIQEVTYADELIGHQLQGFLGMLAPGDSGEILPGLAENWTHNEDFTEWNYTLREDLTFHDGTSVNARAVEYSVYANYMTYLNSWWFSANISSAKDYLSQGIGLQGMGLNITFPENDPNGEGRVIILKSSFPNRQIEWYNCLRTMYALVPYGSHGELTDSADICMNKSEDFSKNPVYAGPYKLKNWSKGEYVRLERFDDWFGWGQTLIGSYGKQYLLPEVDEAFQFIEFVDLTDSTDLPSEILDENVDVILSQDFIHIDNTTAEIYSAIEKTEGFSVKKGAKGDTAFIFMNIQGDYPKMFGGSGNFPLSESWFRQAVSHAIDRDKLVRETYKDIGWVADTFFPTEILENFPNIDTSDYHDFDQGSSIAESILDANGYPPLAFQEEPKNRFGYGPYLNETRPGETRGHHFTLYSPESASCDSRTRAIVEDLEKVGIYVTFEIVDANMYFDLLYGDPGYSFNRSYDYTDDGDPEFSGPDGDFFLHGLGSMFSLPHLYVGMCSNIDWYWGGYGPNSWFNNDYEIAIAKLDDGYGAIDYLPYGDPPPEWPFPYPGIRNNDVQYIAGCEEAGYILSEELPVIPLIWYAQIYAINNHVLNFTLDQTSRLAGGIGMVHVAYSHWDPGDEPTTPSSSTSTIADTSSNDHTNPVTDYLLLINLGLTFLVFISRKKQKRH